MGLNAKLSRFLSSYISRDIKYKMYYIFRLNFSKLSWIFKYRTKTYFIQLNRFYYPKHLNIIYAYRGLIHGTVGWSTKSSRGHINIIKLFFPILEKIHYIEKNPIIETFFNILTYWFFFNIYVFDFYKKLNFGIVTNFELVLMLSNAF